MGFLDYGHWFFLDFYCIMDMKAGGWVDSLGMPSKGDEPMIDNNWRSTD